MGFIQPSPPPVDVEEWKRLGHLERIKPLAQDWAINGFGTPNAIYLLYVVKLIVFAVAGFAIIGATTPGLGGLGGIGDWWTEPIVFQKVVVWLVLWEIIGLGCGSMPLTFRFLPPIGGILYWLRPGTVMLSGIAAAEAAFAALAEGRAHDELAAYQEMCSPATSRATSGQYATPSRCGRALAPTSASRSAASTCGSTRSSRAVFLLPSITRNRIMRR